MANGILIGLAGRARVGKSSFVEVLDEHLLEQRPSRHVTEFAFATELKRELDPMLRAKYGISAFTTDSAEKLIIRPYLVARGAGARAEDPNHWVKIVEPMAKTTLARGDVVIISDCRYRNECDWVHSLGGKVIYIERLQSDRIPVPPANDEEARNDPEARAVADLTLSWPTFEGDHLNKMYPYVLEAWTELVQSLSLLSQPNGHLTQ